MKMGKWLLVALGLTLGIAGTAGAQTVEIEYWQYTFAQRVQAIDELIKRFEAENPGIKVKHTHVPYDDFRLKIAAAIPAGQGPDVVQLFYGWLQDYLKAKLLQPLPAELFDAAEIERDFFPLVKQMKVDGRYYAVPTAVRSLSLFWNKKLFTEAGLDPAKPPQTLDELLDTARKLTKRDAGGNLLQAGIALDMGLQDHHWLREVLIRQMGGQPYSADGRTVAYNTPAGAPRRRLVHRPRDQAQGRRVRVHDGRGHGVPAGKAGLMIDGSFRLAAFDAQAGLDYGVGRAADPPGQALELRLLLGQRHHAEGDRRQAGRGGEVPQVHHHAGGDGAVAREGGRAARPGRRWPSATPIRNNPKYGAVHPRASATPRRPSSSTRRPSASSSWTWSTASSSRPSRCRSRSRRRPPRSRSCWTRFYK